MVGLLFVLFVVVPLVELYVIVSVAHLIGLLPTLVALLAVSFLGAWLVKREGLGVYRRLRSSVNRGEVPATELVDGGLLVAAGAMCVVPGFVTDGLGLLLVVPPVRAFVRNRLIARWGRGRGFAGVGRPYGAGGGFGIVDVEHLGDVTPPRQRPSDPSAPPTELGPGR